MENKQHQGEKPIDKLSRYKKPELLYGVGTFTRKRRSQLLGLKPKHEKKDITDKGSRLAENQFWYQTRKIIQGSLSDLALFIETAGKDNVNQVVTAETLKPIVHSLLWYPILDQDKPDRQRAEIAQLFIEQGLRYLGAKHTREISLSENRIIDEALDLARLLVETFSRVRTVER